MSRADMGQREPFAKRRAATPVMPHSSKLYNHLVQLQPNLAHQYDDACFNMPPAPSPTTGQ